MRRLWWCVFLLAGCASAEPLSREFPEHIVTLNTSPPGAVVMMDGAVLCRETPCRRLFAPGSYALTLLMEAHDARREVLTVKSDAEVTWPLDFEGALLSVDTGEARGVSVRVDGSVVGETPLVERPLAPGEHEVVLESPCWERIALALDMVQGEEERLVFSPGPLRSPLRVLVEGESGEEVVSEVWVDGELLGRSRDVLEVPQCARALEIRGPEGERFRAYLTQEALRGGLVHVKLRSWMKRDQMVELVHIGKVLPEIHRRACLPWESEEVQTRAGSSGWSGFVPRVGDLGRVVAAMPHCKGGEVVVLVNIRDHLVPVAASGLRGSWDEVRPTEGAVMEITHPGRVWRYLHLEECLKWPSEEMRRLAGSRSWGAFEPRRGDRGEVVWSAPHCKFAETVYVLKIGEFLVPVGEAAARAVSGGVRRRQPFRRGAKVVLVERAHAYPEIHKTECLIWNRGEWKTRVARPLPDVGTRGMVLGLARHCEHGGTVYLVETDAGVVAVSAEGIAPQLP